MGGPTRCVTCKLSAHSKVDLPSVRLGHQETDLSGSCAALETRSAELRDGNVLRERILAVVQLGHYAAAAIACREGWLASMALPTHRTWARETGPARRGGAGP